MTELATKYNCDSSLQLKLLRALFYEKATDLIRTRKMRTNQMNTEDDDFKTHPYGPVHLMAFMATDREAITRFTISVELLRA